MQKITGVGGVFFKARNPQALSEWYAEHLGLQFQHGFVMFDWTEDQANKAAGCTIVAVFKEDAAKFDPGGKPYMINFRVGDLRGLITELQEKGVPIVGDIEDSDFGLFGWILDPEGNKIELWEPK